jgi:hypothetical protein
MRQPVRDNVRMWPDSFRRTVVRDELAQAPPPLPGIVNHFTTRTPSKVPPGKWVHQCKAG